MYPAAVTDAALPRRAEPLTETPLPKQHVSRTLADPPTKKWWSTDAALPSRDVALVETALPKVAWRQTLTPVEARKPDKMLIVLPARISARDDNELPKAVKFKVLIDDPLSLPRMDTLLPTSAADLTDSPLATNKVLEQLHASTKAGPPTDSESPK